MNNEYEKIEMPGEIVHWQGEGYYASVFSEFHQKMVTLKLEDGYPSQRDAQARGMGLGTPHHMTVKPN